MGTQASAAASRLPSPLDLKRTAWRNSPCAVMCTDIRVARSPFGRHTFDGKNLSHASGQPSQSTGTGELPEAGTGAAVASASACTVAEYINATQEITTAARRMIVCMRYPPRPFQISAEFGRVIQGGSIPPRFSKSPRRRGRVLLRRCIIYTQCDPRLAHAPSWRAIPLCQAVRFRGANDRPANAAPRTRHSQPNTSPMRS